jgi:protein-S-isoprenylcysteine O-methyltransferase Ste14
VNVGSIIVATVLLSVSFGSSPRWRTYRSTAVVLTLLILVAFVIQFRTLHRA